MAQSIKSMASELLGSEPDENRPSDEAIKRILKEISDPEDVASMIREGSTGTARRAIIKAVNRAASLSDLGLHFDASLKPWKRGYVNPESLFDALTVRILRENPPPTSRKRSKK